jgi:hypothetical protein
MTSFWGIVGGISSKVIEYEDMLLWYATIIDFQTRQHTKKTSI